MDIDHFLSSHNRTGTNSFFCSPPHTHTHFLTISLLETKIPLMWKSDTFSSVTANFLCLKYHAFVTMCVCVGLGVGVCMCAWGICSTVNACSHTSGGGTMNTQQQSADASRSNSFPSKALDRGGSGFPVRASARNSARSCTTRDQSVGLDSAHCVIRTPYENNGSFFFIYMQ